MMGNRHSEFEGSITAVQFECSHSVIANSLCGRSAQGCTFFFSSQSKYCLMLKGNAGIFDLGAMFIYLAV